MEKRRNGEMKNIGVWPEVRGDVLLPTFYVVNLCISKKAIFFSFSEKKSLSHHHTTRRFSCNLFSLSLYLQGKEGKRGKDVL